MILFHQTQDSISTVECPLPGVTGVMTFLRKWIPLKFKKFNFNFYSGLCKSVSTTTKTKKKKKKDAGDDNFLTDSKHITEHLKARTVQHPLCNAKYYFA